MQHNEFRIGETFWCGGHRWLCTDCGTRTITAICLDRVNVESTSPELVRTLGRAEAEAQGWFNGPPYAVLEHVFDEDAIVNCSIAPDHYNPVSEHDLTGVESGVPRVTRDGSARDGSADNLTVRAAYIRTIRDQTHLGGLRFEAYLPPALAEWLLARIESGLFTSPAEAVFVLFTEHRELERYPDLRDEMLRRSCEALLEDRRAPIPLAVFEERLARLREAPQSAPARWDEKIR